MKTAHDAGNRKDYIEDLKTIKELLIEVEEKPIIESWGFFTWGLCIVLGSIFHYIMEVHFGFKALDIALKVWLPVFLVGGFFECIAYIKRMTKESIPLLSRTMKKFVFTFATLLLSFGVMMGILIRLHALFYIPTLITLFIGISFACYAFVCATWMYFPAFFLILLGLLLFIFEVHSPIMSLVVGGAIAIAFLWGGFTSLKRESK
ncbi:MAG: hypothetical protein JW822_01800 [Spirochaetales bacterium]|nr:hypothetical protein [Spirochaetales bacterium]